MFNPLPAVAMLRNSRATYNREHCSKVLEEIATLIFLSDGEGRTFCRTKEYRNTGPNDKEYLTGMIKEAGYEVKIQNFIDTDTYCFDISWKDTVFI